MRPSGADRREASGSAASSRPLRHSLIKRRRRHIKLIRVMLSAGVEQLIVVKLMLMAAAPNDDHHPAHRHRRGDGRRQPAPTRR